MRSGNLLLICSLGGVFTVAFSTREFCTLKLSLNFQKQTSWGGNHLRGRSRQSSKINPKSKLPTDPFSQCGAKAEIKHGHTHTRTRPPQNLPWLRSPGLNRSELSFHLSIPGMYPTASDSLHVCRGRVLGGDVRGGAMRLGARWGMPRMPQQEARRHNTSKWGN